jgi:hypothetical protein
VRYDPVVLICLPVHDAFDRCALSIRDAPKPRYELVGGEPALEAALVPTLDEHLREAFPWYECWGWRLLVHSGVLDSLDDGLGAELAGEEATELALEELGRRLLERLVADLRGFGVRFGFVLLSDLASFEDPDALDWREQILFDVLNAQGAPYVLVRGALEREIARSRRPAADYYLPGEQQDRLSPLGEELVLREVTGLVGRLIVGAPPYVPPPESIALEGFEEPVLPTRHSAVQYLKKKGLLVVRAGMGEPTEVRYSVGGNARLHFQASCPLGEGPAERAADAGAELSVLADGRAIAALRLARGAPPQTLELDAAGARELVIRLSNAGPEPWQVVHLSAIDPSR